MTVILKIKQKILFGLLLSIFIVFPFFQSRAIEYVCNGNQRKLQRTKLILNKFKLQTEAIFYDREKGCLIIDFKQNRQRLFQKLLRGQGLSFSSNGQSASTLSSCNVKFQIQDKSKINKNKLNLGRSTKIEEINSLGQNNEIRSLKVSSSLDSQINVNGKILFLNCTPLTNSFRVVLSLKSLNNIHSSGISTTVNISKNQKINIGSIAKELNKKQNNKNITSGISISKVEGKITKDYYIWIE